MRIFLVLISMFFLAGWGSMFPCVLQGLPSASVSCPVREMEYDFQRLTPSENMEIVSVDAGIKKDRLLVEIKTKEKFDNSTDQNIYIFLGSEKAEKTRFILSEDTQYFADASYDVINSIDMFHSNEVMIGIYDPLVLSFSPQVFYNAERKYQTKGNETGIVQNIKDNVLSVEIPLDLLENRKDLKLTVATAKDYVGFIDKFDFGSIGKTREKIEKNPVFKAVHYPLLNEKSHIFKNINITRAMSFTSVEFEMEAPVTDWLQTNFNLFFIPEKPVLRQVKDPVGTKNIPEWFYYCGVYSPSRIFCKASDKDFSYDVNYSERKSLKLPDGIVFKKISNKKFLLSFDALKVNAFTIDRKTVRNYSLIISSNRDGFPASVWYGLK